MHLVAPAVAAHIRVPLIDIIDETGRAIRAAGCRRPLLLATRYTMEHGFYADRMAQAHGLAVEVPQAAERAEVHGIIFEELCQGRVLAPSRARLLAAIDKGVRAGADAVILGCTEICMILDASHIAVPTFDSTAIHAAAAVDFALGSAGLSSAA